MRIRVLINEVVIAEEDVNVEYKYLDIERIKRFS